MEATSKSIEQTKELALKISSLLKPGVVLALYGDLGSGKTTFTRYLVEALGLAARVQSPTFIISREYDVPEKSSASEQGITKVHHIDLYRLQSPGEVLDIGLGEILNEGTSLKIIEWPQIIEEMLPLETVKIKFDYINENERKLSIQNLY